MNCPTCGQRIISEQSDEGTAHYIGVERAKVIAEVHSVIRRFPCDPMDRGSIALLNELMLRIEALRERP